MVIDSSIYMLLQREKKHSSEKHLHNKMNTKCQHTTLIITSFKWLQHIWTKFFQHYLNYFLLWLSCVAFLFPSQSETKTPFSSFFFFANKGVMQCKPGYVQKVTEQSRNSHFLFFCLWIGYPLNISKLYVPQVLFKSGHGSILKICLTYVP